MPDFGRCWAATKACDCRHDGHCTHICGAFAVSPLGLCGRHRDELVSDTATDDLGWLDPGAKA